MKLFALLATPALAMTLVTEPAAAGLDQDLVAHWSFDGEKDGHTVRDVTGHGHDGEMNVAPDAHGRPITQAVTLNDKIATIALRYRDALLDEGVKVVRLDRDGLPTGELREETDFKVIPGKAPAITLLDPSKVEPGSYRLEYRYTNDALTREDGINQSAMAFDGYNDWIEVAKIDDLEEWNAITLAFWIYPEGKPGVEQMIRASSLKGGGWGAMMNDKGKLQMWHVGIPENLNSHRWDQVTNFQTVLPRDQWSHVAMVFTGSEVQLWIDGNLVETKEAFGMLQPVTEGILRIGGDANFNFRGRLDEVRIYKRALAGEEIKELHEKKL